ncbi:MAG TPA: ArsR family transcriptional regulator [Aggregatilineaceae bacterium]|jgi:predicted ArsR family transcriptional regulator|nr:ArsR family transcriptional regulator [Aggregatilineaceae bacterium]
MQQTRRHILEILKERHEATIDEIVEALSARIGKITAVTVRHHLEILRGDGLVAAPAVRRRSAPGRPQYVYTLTERAADQFPNNYQGLAAGLLEQLRDQLPTTKVTQILEGVADKMADQAMMPDAPLEIRLDHAVAYLNTHGYTASWQHNGEGHVLAVTNCPYEQVSCSNPELCTMDKKLMDKLVGLPTQRIAWQQEDSEICTFLIKDRGA